jgi:hypothetical protein
MVLSKTLKIYGETCARAHAHAYPHTPTHTHRRTHTGSWSKQTEHGRGGALQSACQRRWTLEFWSSWSRYHPQDSETHVHVEKRLEMRTIPGNLEYTYRRMLRNSRSTRHVNCEPKRIVSQSLWVYGKEKVNILWAKLNIYIIYHIPPYTFRIIEIKYIYIYLTPILQHIRPVHTYTT